MITRMSVFDLDRTLVTGNSSFAFCHYLIGCGVLPRSAMAFAALCYLRYTYFGMTLPELHHTIFDSLLRGKSLDLLQQHVESFVEFYLSKHTNPHALAALRLAQHLGEYTLILSNGPQFLVSAFARAFNVNEWGSTQYGVDENQSLVKIETLLLGEDKAKWVHEAVKRLGIDPQKVAAYSDSYLDLPLLLAVGEPVVVSPDPKLRKIALMNSWRLM